MRSPALFQRLVIFAFVCTLLVALTVYQRDRLAAGVGSVVDSVKTAADSAKEASKNIPIPFVGKTDSEDNNGDATDNTTDNTTDNATNEDGDNDTNDTDSTNTTNVAADKTNKPAPPDKYISICLAVKDQRLDLPEFLRHHYYNMGVGHFFIMDDGSEPPLSELTDEELTIPRDAVEFHYFRPDQHVQWMQYTMYNTCKNVASNHSSVNTTWMAFIDADEFIDAPGPQTLREVLEDFGRIEAIGGVALNWRVHTSGGHLTRQPSVISAFTECIYDDPEHNGNDTNNRHVKSIVKLKHMVQPRNPHSFILTPNHFSVGENGDVVESHLRAPITRDRLAIHHYALKSKAEFEDKMSRGSGMSHHNGWSVWDNYEKMPHEPCEEMLRWANT
ncbi:hypothetical protein HMPREF1624_05348 [Sporothrix schenckii ATCC 58251]|uniref:Glycosyltransferase family 92 protein n=1 Tax=Sporothrix schenckii (strain ATCC 58251 / de Perez 2211183) TaxID=1391915 RepID=U7PSE4_SPOS1|nr:hypothetical protein HMPREF1624_05348 [Sporothrix schenckii ATCC 58251]